jgi:hypothetical protein
VGSGREGLADNGVREFEITRVISDVLNTTNEGCVGHFFPQGWVIRVHGRLHTHCSIAGYRSGPLVRGIDHPVGQRDGGLAGGWNSHHAISLDGRYLGGLQTSIVAIVQLLHKLVQKFGSPEEGMKDNFLSVFRVTFFRHARRGHVLPVTNLGLTDQLPAAIVRTLLPCTILPLLPLLGRLLLSLRHILDAESSTRLVVTMRGSLDVFSGVGSSSVVVYVVYERVRRPLVGWTQEPDTNKQTNRENASKNKTL